MKRYIPEKGDIISLSFDPQSGHEQKGRRPAIVVSNKLFNERTGLALVCPITNTTRNWPIHVPVPSGSGLTGHIMVEQVKSVDYYSRTGRFIMKADSVTINEVLAILDAVIFE